MCGSRSTRCADDLAEVRLEVPEVVEMLARPQKEERRADGRLVAAASGIPDAREEAAAAVGVADVRRRDRALVHERVAERDVPGLQRVQLAVEVLAAALEPRAAVRHASELGERLRRPSP